MKNITRLLLASLLWAAACKKGELPPDDFGSPVFGVQFSTAGAADTVTAGVDNVYLFTRYHVADQKVVCSGSFSNVNCPDGDCPGSLTFEFKSVLTDIFGPDTVFHLGEYDFLNPDSTGSVVFRTTFNVSQNNDYSDFLWEIDDAPVDSGMTLVQDFPNEQPRLIELTAYKPGLESQITRTISLTNPGQFFPIVGINADTAGTGYELIAEISDTSGISLLWNTDSTSAAIFQDSLMASPYVVTATDDLGNTASARFTNLSPDDLPVRTAGFTYSVEEIFTPALPGEVAIQWVDGQGTVWRSDWGFQTPNASFFVETSMPYEVNETGQKTRKMQVIVVNCRLFNNVGESIGFAGEGVIAVAHP